MKIVKRLTALALAACCAAGLVPCAGAADVQTRCVSVSFSDSAFENCTLRVIREGRMTAAAADDLIYADEAVLSENGEAVFEIPTAAMNSRCRYIAVSSSGETVTGSISGDDKISDNEAYYLADDDFTMLKANDADELSDWGYDVLETAGTIGYSSEGLSLADTSAAAATRVRRAIQRQSGVMVYAELRMKLSDVSDGYGFWLYDGKSKVVGVETAQGALVCGDARLCDISSGAEYGIRLEVNLLTQQAKAYVNGEILAEGIGINSGSVNSVEISTSKEGTGTLGISCVRVMRGYYAADEFVAYTNNQAVTDGIWEKNSRGGSVSIIKTVGTPTADYYSLCLKDVSSAGTVGISKALENVSGAVKLDFKLYSATIINNLDITLGTLSAKIESGGLKIKTADGAYKSICTLPEKLWCTVRICADFDSAAADVSVNGKLKADGISFAKEQSEPELLSFETGKAAADTLWLDDIYLAADTEYDDYPSEPAKLSKSGTDVIVGMQTCDLWRQGKHFGWDKINGYPSRKPYLGYYDDGSTEAADWEIKYMVEHGVDFAIRCWYRPGNIAAPIKEPRNGYAIHDGYFNAKYKDKIKFAIAWENGGWLPADTDAAMNDFKENIVPFWLEYYFKDPNYFVLDNKIVLNIYDVNKLAARFGADGAKEAVAYLTAEVKKIGFDGIYLIGQTSSSDAAVLQSYKDYGYDAVYCYSYGQNNMSVVKQADCIAAQKNAGVISSIPTIAMGRDDTAWNRTAGGFLTPCALELLCSRVKDTYFANGAAGDELGDRMVVLDNWNEYGEGHYFMPSGIAGFAYLEAVGKVFGQPEHRDIRPRDTARLGRLYDGTRQLENKEGALKWYDTFEEQPLLNYSTTADFKKCSIAGSSYYSKFESKDDVLTATPRSRYSADPYFYTADNLNLALTGREVIHFRYKKPASASRITVYFSTTDDVNMNGAKSFSQTVPDTEDWIDIYFETDKNTNWTGYLKRLQIRPFGGGSGTDTFQFDTIEILRYGSGGYEPEEYSVKLAGFTQNGSEAYARYDFCNPYDDMKCDYFVAEYLGTDLTDVRFVQDYVIKNGSSSLEIPFSARSGYRYHTGIWDKQKCPLTQVGELICE